MSAKGFTKEQVDQLLKPINPSRVLADGKGFSHVSQQDILAHLTRIFGFGNFDIDVKDVSLVFETERGNDRFDVCYKALVRLTIRDPQGIEICHYENGSMETSQNQKKGDGHDLAYKSAISLSIKRAAIALGDQFGLSLYNKGQMTALVRNTLVGSVQPVEDVQEGVPQQVSLGNDEKEETPVEALEGTSKAITPQSVTITPPVAPDKPAKKPAEEKPASEGLLLTAYAIIENSTTLEQLRNVWTQNSKHLDQQFTVKNELGMIEGVLTTDYKLTTLRIEIEAKKDFLTPKGAK